jgi:hypothetical protein
MLTCLPYCTCFSVLCLPCCRLPFLAIAALPREQIFSLTSPFPPSCRQITYTDFSAFPSDFTNSTSTSHSAFATPIQYPTNIRMFQSVPLQTGYSMNTLSAVAPPGAVQLPDQMSHIPIDGPLLEQMGQMSIGRGQHQGSARLGSADFDRVSPVSGGLPRGSVGSIGEGKSR